MGKHGNPGFYKKIAIFLLDFSVFLVFYQSRFLPQLVLYHGHIEEKTEGSGIFPNIRYHPSGSISTDCTAGPSRLSGNHHPGS